MRLMTDGFWNLGSELLTHFRENCLCKNDVFPTQIIKPREDTLLFLSQDTLLNALEDEGTSYDS